jgi:hypothetical protein
MTSSISNFKQRIRSIAPQMRRWIASPLALLAMTSKARHSFALAGDNRPEVMQFVSLRNQRARGMPGAQCTRSLVCAIGSEVCTPVFTAEAPEPSGIPHAMVLTVSFVLSPVTSSFLPPSPLGLNGISSPGWADDASARLDISNGCQDHTTSPYASAPFVCVMCHRSRVFTRPAIHPSRRRCRVHRIPPHVS